MPIDSCGLSLTENRGHFLHPFVKTSRYNHSSENETFNTGIVTIPLKRQAVSNSDGCNVTPTSKFVPNKFESSEDSGSPNSS